MKYCRECRHFDGGGVVFISEARCKLFRMPCTQANPPNGLGNCYRWEERKPSLWERFCEAAWGILGIR